jgi:membrane-bound lytic murein transglycosylase MltF
MSSLIYALSIDGELSDIERNFFAVAAYNAGPNNIRKARQLASTMGFDPNKWFENVEMTTAKLFGIETFLYVRNVYKYYVVYDIRQRNIPITQEKLIPERVVQ